MSYTLEICVDSLTSAKNAELGGATRLELCENLVIGGTTPSPAFFRQVREAVSLPIHVLVRPRFGDFLYSDEEAERVSEEIRELYHAGVEVFVIGALTADGEIAVEVLKSWMNVAPNAKFVCHRAIDMSADIEKSLSKLVEMGFSGVLTSGGEGDALQGAKKISEMVKKANDRIEIIVGAGVNSGNIAELVRLTGANAYHMSGKAEIESAMKYRNSKVFMGLPSLSEYIVYETQIEQVQKAKAELIRIEG